MAAPKKKLSSQDWSQEAEKRVLEFLQKHKAWLLKRMQKAPRDVTEEPLLGTI